MDGCTDAVSSDAAGAGTRVGHETELGGGGGCEIGACRTIVNGGTGGASSVLHDGDVLVRT